MVSMISADVCAVVSQDVSDRLCVTVEVLHRIEEEHIARRAALRWNDSGQAKERSATD